MTAAERLTAALVDAAADETFTHASLLLRDGSRLQFRHRVDERWVKADGPVEDAAGAAHELLADLTTFRLNAKHLDIRFDDGSRWDHPVPASLGPRGL